MTPFVAVLKVKTVLFVEAPLLWTWDRSKRVTRILYVLFVHPCPISLSLSLFAITNRSVLRWLPMTTCRNLRALLGELLFIYPQSFAHSSCECLPCVWQADDKRLLFALGIRMRFRQLRTRIQTSLVHTLPPFCCIYKVPLVPKVRVQYHTSWSEIRLPTGDLAKCPQWLKFRSYELNYFVWDVPFVPWVPKALVR